jgi:hypothetical protein
MHFGVRHVAAAISAAALIFCCSCEKHRVGEDPEAQKERADELKGSEQNSSETKPSTESPAVAGSPTPVNFFPEKSPPP